MRVLVTGGAGFIGSEVVKQLIEAKHEPIVVDDLTQGHVKAVPVPVVRCDIANFQHLRSVFALMKPEAVIHLAALVSVSDSVSKPGDYWRTNVVGTLNVLDCMIEQNLRTLVFASSAAVYGDFYGAACEHYPCTPTNPYAQSKLMAEQMIQSYGIDATCFRFFNVGGAGEDHDPETHLIPNVCRALRGQPLNVYGFDYPTKDGTALRDYVHVSDIARAHIMALGRPGFNVYNLGNGCGFTCLELVRAVEVAAGETIPIVMCGRRPGDIPGFIADYSKAYAELGWQPKCDLETIARDAVAWSLAHPEGYDD
jgi:UDP-glucose 4-epimerase